MTATRWTALLLAALYVAFFGWYTSFGGPLTPDEIEAYMAFAEAHRQGPDDHERLAILREFMESDTGDDFIMWNVVDYHDEPLAVEGVDPDMSSEEVVAKYMEYMFPAMLRRACHPVIGGIAGSRAVEMFGVEGVRVWDQGVAMRYRSRRDMLEIALNPEFQGAHAFKVAGIDKTFAFPLDPWSQLGDPRLVLALVFLVIGLSVSSFAGRRRRAADAPSD